METIINIVRFGYYNKMRLYSNIKITWPQILHIHQYSRKTPGKWDNYYIYQVITNNPIMFDTSADMKPLSINRYYYCYDPYYYNKKLDCYNTIYNYTKTDINIENNIIYYPANVNDGDLIVVYN
jgi:hypothetical protein